LTPGSSTRCVCVADIEPKCAIGPQYSPDFAKNFNQMCDIVIDLFLCPYLSLVPVITHSPIGRGSDSAVKSIVWEQGKFLPNVTVDDLNRVGSGKYV